MQSTALAAKLAAKPPLRGSFIQVPCVRALLCTASGQGPTPGRGGQGQGRRPDALLCQHGLVHQLPGCQAAAVQALQRLQKVLLTVLTCTLPHAGVSHVQLPGESCRWFAEHLLSCMRGPTPVMCPSPSRQHCDAWPVPVDLRHAGCSHVTHRCCRRTLMHDPRRLVHPSPLHTPECTEAVHPLLRSWTLHPQP